MPTPSYIEHADTIAVSGWEIPAALTLPADTGTTPLPSAVLLIPGSLYSDVNGDFPTWNCFPAVYAHLARQLAARGHAVYRFAKLGPGTGSVKKDETATARVSNWGGRLVIATAALDAMRAALASRGVAVERIIGAGHSEGAVVVSQLATSDRGAELDGVVLLAGPAVGLLDIMREQTAQSVPPEQHDEALRRMDAVISYIRRGEAVPAELSEGPGYGATTLAKMPEEGRRYMRETDATNPNVLAANMTQSVLVVQGSSDQSVPPHHGETLRDTLRARQAGEGRSAYLFVEDVHHMFKVVPPDVPPMQAFAYPGPVDERVVEGIDRWVRQLAG